MVITKLAQDKISIMVREAVREPCNTPGLPQNARLERLFKQAEATLYADPESLKECYRCTDIGLEFHMHEAMQMNTGSMIARKGKAIGKLCCQVRGQLFIKRLLRG
jgi:hypothetical protein